MNKLIWRCLGRRKTSALREYVRFLWRRLHVWLSAHLQSWHFNQEPSEASFFWQIRAARVPIVLFSQEILHCIKLNKSRALQGMPYIPFTQQWVISSSEVLIINTVCMLYLRAQFIKLKSVCYHKLSNSIHTVKAIPKY